ncbi:unnamed protein product [Pelagomonas calceolata]|uniref:BZIP domain-containing protein n=1 Tax=Pelagomonas calceolata TaxID=35677 RepID=A0A8J2S9Y9_9STRA|nr:unnamed protein product [Pelagomonas calceolata]|mmetsp:Transcript_15812/g.44977  ORF Transcript_15812/g.44977 Transcript_15812/m.44977 type:complete len:192 (+) Transcript_15812:121-696(+)
MAEVPVQNDAPVISESDLVSKVQIEPTTEKRPREEPSVEQAAAAMQALVRAPAPAPSVPAPPESPRQADEERNRERNRGYARAYRERKRLKLQTLENCRQELLKENARLLEEAQARDRKEAALSAERDAARDRLARVEAENRALRAWIHQLNAPPAQMALKQPMMGMGVALDPQVPRRAVLVPRDAVPVSE